MKHPLQLAPQGTTAGAVQFRQVAVSPPEGLRILKLPQAHCEGDLQQWKLEVDPVDGASRQRPKQQGQSS
jgi:hypothetical protein